MTVFNEVHNNNLNSSVGIVSVLTEDNKRVYKKLKEHGTDITYENEFKIKKWIIDYAYGIKWKADYLYGIKWKADYLYGIKWKADYTYGIIWKLKK